MKYLLLSAALCLLLVPDVQAQAFADSFFVEVWKSPAGEKFALELKEFSRNPLDATGDGISELITVEDNQNGLPILMRVRDLTTSTEIMTIDLRLVREKLASFDFSEEDLRALRFFSFYPGEEDALGWVIFEGNDNPAFLIYDPNNPLILGMPDVIVSSIYDYNGDGFQDISVNTKTASVILTSVHASRN